MEPQVLQQLIEAIQQLNNRITHLDGDISNMNNRLNTLSNDTRRSTASLESLTNETKKHRSGNRETQVNDATQALINAAKNIVLESTAAAHKTSGDHGIRVRARNRADRIGENYEEALKNRLDMFINAWGRDHRNSQVAYHEEEGIRNILRDLTEDIGNAVGTLRNELENSRSLLNVGGRARDHVIINMDKDYRESINNRGEKEYITISSVFSQAREDVKKLSNDIIQLSNDIKQTQDTVKLTNDVVLDLATNSDAVNKIMLDMNVNMEMANDNLRIFNMLLTSAGNAQWQQETSIKNNIQVMGQMRSMMLQMNATMHQLTNANTAALQNLRNTLNDNGTSNSGSANTFQQQATRNSDRAKQAGFIALLIPALAKLLQKTPITDFLRYLALKLGSGLSGKGEHPVLGTVGLGLASIIPTAAASKWIANALFGKGGGSVLGHLPLSQTGKYAKGIIQGATSTHLDRLGANVDRVSLGAGEWATDNMGNYVFDKAGNRILTHQTGNVAGGLGYEAGRKFARRLPRIMKVGIGRAAQRIPILGTAVSAALEVPDLIKAGRSGNKEVWGNQLAKSTGGVAGGTIGAIAGGALGSLVGPIGTIIGGAIGGFIGDAIGRFVGPPIRKGFQNAMSGLKSTFESIKEHTKGVKEGFGKLGKSFGRIGAAFGRIGAAFGNLFSPITSRLGKLANKVQSWIGKLISSGVEKTIEWIVKGIDNFVTKTDNFVTKIDKTVNTIADLIDTIADGFHDLGQKLLSTPIIGPILQKIYGETPETNTVTNNTSDANRKERERVNKELLKYQDPNSKEYKAKRQEFYDQYIRANQSGWFVGAEENAKLEKEASKWADKMMNEEKYKLKVQKAALENGVGTSALPSNLTTVKKNGVNAVAMKDLGLNGTIGKGNSVPYIAAANAQNLKNLDNYLSSKGYKFTYTSAMGGSHAGGAKSHGAGQKVDLVLNQGGKLRPEDERWLMANGFYGGATGAVGYHNAGSGYHYDLSVSGGKGLTEAQMAEYEKSVAAKTSTQTATTKEETASSNIRSGLLDIVGAKNKSDKQEKARNIIFSAVDVTGSLGVWGITQLNNGVMRTGR